MAAIRDKETVKKITSTNDRTKSFAAALQKGTQNFLATLKSNNFNKESVRISEGNEQLDVENMEKKGISLTSVAGHSGIDGIINALPSEKDNMLDISTKAFDKEIKDMIKGCSIDILVIALAIIVAMVIMHHLEGWDYTDSFYFTVVTISTIGYGDFRPTNDSSRTFIIFYTLVGTALLVRSCTNLVKIPILIRSRKNEIDIIRQFGGENLELTTEQLKAVFEADIFRKYPTIKKCENELSKAEFVILLLSMMDRLNEKDLILACKLFDKLDRDDRRYLHKDDINLEIQRSSVANLADPRSSATSNPISSNSNTIVLDNNLKTSLL